MPVKTQTSVPSRKGHPKTYLFRSTESGGCVASILTCHLYGDLMESTKEEVARRPQWRHGIVYHILQGDGPGQRAEFESRPTRFAFLRPNHSPVLHSFKLNIRTTFSGFYWDLGQSLEWKRAGRGLAKHKWVWPAKWLEQKASVIITKLSAWLWVCRKRNT